jgi:hypothetical protein
MNADGEMVSQFSGINVVNLPINQKNGPDMFFLPS